MRIRNWMVGRAAIRGRPLWVEDDGAVILGNDFGGIVRFEPNETRLTVLSPSPYAGLRRIATRWRLAARACRSAPRCLALLPSGTLLWASSGRIWRLAHDESSPTEVLTFSTGSGPLFLAVDPRGDVTFGDYVASRERSPTAVRRSVDEGRSWTVIHEFGSDRIRHVHGTFWDPYSRKLWLTTGDGPEESGLWTLENDIPQMIAGGRAIFRIVQPIFTRDAIYFGTDTPGDNCGIYRMSRTTLVPEFLCHTRGPTFFGTMAGKQFVFSTSVEPGHPIDHACLYTSSDGENFQESLVLRKDRWPMRLFQYGQIHIPANANPGNRLWFAPCAVEGDGNLFSIETGIV